jgi:hypothetical protein
MSQNTSTSTATSTSTECHEANHDEKNQDPLEIDQHDDLETMLRDLYWNHGNTIPEIADKIDKSVGYVSEKLTEYGIPTRAPEDYTSAIPAKEFLEALYWSNAAAAATITEHPVSLTVPETNPNVTPDGDAISVSNSSDSPTIAVINDRLEYSFPDRAAECTPGNTISSRADRHACLSINEIADVVNASTSVVHSWLKAYDIPRVGVGESRTRPSEETLRELHFEEDLTLAEIGEEYAVTGAAVSQWFDKYGIER